MPKADTAHPAGFYRCLAEIEREDASRAGALISRAIKRGAIGPDRAAHYASLALAGKDISALDELTALPRSLRAAGPVRAGYDDDLARLWPPHDRAWADRPAEPERIAASTPAGDEDEDPGDLECLWPPRPGREREWAAARAAADREAIAADARRQAEADEDLAALFPPEPPS